MLPLFDGDLCLHLTQKPQAVELVAIFAPDLLAGPGRGTGAAIQPATVRP